jgi:hypothetical protein
MTTATISTATATAAPERREEAVQEIQHIPQTAQSALTLRRSWALLSATWQLNGPSGFHAALLFASPIRSRGSKTFRLLVLGPQSIEATSQDFLHWFVSSCRLETAQHIRLITCNTGDHDPRDERQCR